MSVTKEELIELRKEFFALVTDVGKSEMNQLFTEMMKTLSSPSGDQKMNEYYLKIADVSAKHAKEGMDSAQLQSAINSIDSKLTALNPSYKGIQLGQREVIMNRFELTSKDEAYKKLAEITAPTTALSSGPVSRGSAVARSRSASDITIYNNYLKYQQCLEIMNSSKLEENKDKFNEALTLAAGFLERLPKKFQESQISKLEALKDEVNHTAKFTSKG